MSLLGRKWPYFRAPCGSALDTHAGSSVLSFSRFFYIICRPSTSRLFPLDTIALPIFATSICSGYDVQTGLEDIGIMFRWFQYLWRIRVNCHVTGNFWIYFLRASISVSNLSQQFWLQRRWLCRIPSAGFDKMAFCHHQQAPISQFLTSGYIWPDYVTTLQAQIGSQITYGLFLFF